MLRKIDMDPKDELIFDLVNLFEAWKNGILRDIIKWEKEPPAIQRAKQYLGYDEAGHANS